MTRTRRTRLRILLAQIAAAALLVSGISIGSTAATAEAATDGCINSDCGFPWEEWEGSMNKTYWGAYSGHNCTNYVAWRLIRNGDTSARTGLGSAGNWKSYALKNNIKVNATPAVGAVAWFDWGHVAYVEKVSNDKKTITIYEDTYNQKKFKVRNLTVGTSSWPDAFLHFRDIGPNKVMSDNVLRLLGSVEGTSLTKYDDYGNNGDIPVFGDWNGDGTDTLGIVRNGKWQLFNGSGKSNPVYPSTKWLAFGTRTKVPFAGDFNGDGVDDIGYKDGTTWYMDYTIGGKNDGKYDKKFTLGKSTDKPIVGDWNGDGTDGIGTVAQSGSKRVWKLWNSPSAPADYTTFSTSMDNVYAVGDWNGDGFDTYGLKKTSSGKDSWTLYNYFPYETAPLTEPGHVAGGAALPEDDGAAPDEVDEELEDTASGIAPPEDLSPDEVEPETEPDEVEPETEPDAAPDVDAAPQVPTDPIAAPSTAAAASGPAVKIFDAPIRLKINLFVKPTPRDIIVVGSWSNSYFNGRKSDSIGLAR